ncbi:hypothetical protein DXA68_09950 [Bacteroides stercorirosoris]|uniref:Uncharacterized protein n=1 Tax=Bacteroides stercorirosoris TaxID=871324 RepID=A0A413H5C3_9BACE|nr:hypothetical protein DXA68_09950 [Bacteroides stercorirosoris]
MQLAGSIIFFAHFSISLFFHLQQTPSRIVPTPLFPLQRLAFFALMAINLALMTINLKKKKN